MDKDFESYDLQKKGFLTYDEYKALSYSNLIKPKDKAEVGDIIYKHDLRSFEKQAITKDYKEYYELYSENGFITFGSLKRLCEKVSFEIGDDVLLKMIERFKNKDTQRLGYEEFCKLMEMID